MPNFSVKHLFDPEIALCGKKQHEECVHRFLHPSQIKIKSIRCEKIHVPKLDRFNFPQLISISSILNKAALQLIVMQYQIRIQFAQIQIGQTFKDLKYIQTLEIHRIDIQTLQLQKGHILQLFHYKKKGRHSSSSITNRADIEGRHTVFVVVWVDTHSLSQGNIELGFL